MVASVVKGLALLVGAHMTRATYCNFSGGFAVSDWDGCDGRSECNNGDTPRCCPDQFDCYAPNIHAYCCPPGMDCTLEDVLNVPRCPDKKWSLWKLREDVDDGAWCCEEDSYGVLVQPHGGDGGGFSCISFGESLGSWTVAATPVGDVEPSCTSDATATTTPTAPAEAGITESTSADDAEDGGASLGGGAIAGVVVGVLAGAAAVVGVMWWVLRRRGEGEPSGEAVEPAGGKGDSAGPILPELDGEPGHTHAELDGGPEVEVGGQQGPYCERGAGSTAIYGIHDGRS